jgi:hypothetical protein
MDAVADLGHVAVRLAGVGGLRIAPAGKPGCYGVGVLAESGHGCRSVAARLAGGGGLEIAIAGKPDCYGDIAAILRTPRTWRNHP